MKICEETIRSAIDKELSDVVMDDAQKQAILARCRPSLTVAPRRRPMRRVLTVAACFAMAMVVGAGALAAAPDLRQSLRGLSEYTIQMLQPVHEVSEDQGIRMEVLGAINDGQSAVAFISLQDTSGQGRISDTVQLMDCKISGSGVFTNDTIVNYDPQTETAVLRLEGIASNVKSQKITVSVGSLLSGETTIENQPTGYTVGELMEIGEETRAFAPTEDQVRQHSMTANDEEMMNEMSELMDNGKIPLLQPWEKPVKINGVDWAEITAATQIGNQVHVRYATGTVLGGISTLNFSLKDENGTVLELPTVEMNIGEPTQVSETIHYTDSNEYVLMLPQDQQAKNMELLYSGVGYEQFTQGKWSTTFKLEQVKEKLSAKVDLQMDDWKLETVSVSPVGVTVTGTGETGCSDVPEVKVWKKDGTEVEVDAISTSMSDDAVSMNSMFTEILNLSEVEKVTLNGEPLQMEHIGLES